MKIEKIYTLSIMHHKIKTEKGIIQTPLLIGIVVGILMLSIGEYKGFEFYRTSKSNRLTTEALLKLKEAQEETDRTKMSQLLSKATNLAKKATDLSPDNAKAWFNKGEIYFNLRPLAMNAREWAIKCYQKALKLDPNAPFPEKARERIRQLEEEMAK
jgi:tetratricopeptide (TPR) repeat protein